MEAKAYYLPGAKGLLSPLQDFLDDHTVSEILINKPQEVFIEHDGKLTRFDIPALTSQYLRRLFLLIANENKQVLSESTPMLSGSLEDGSRVQLVIPPASQYETLSIRKFVLRQVSFEDYSRQGFFDTVQSVNLDNETLQNNDVELQGLYKAQDWQAFITKAILLKKNIIISGGTSSGKTTFLNSCIEKIPLHERLISLEDTYEINVPHPNMVRLLAFKALADQATKITMQDLVQASLRLRPDRLIMGEIRGREVFDFVSASSTGHSGTLATIHANNPKVAFMRMAQLYKLNGVSNMQEEDIYKVLHEVVDIILQVAKTANGRRLIEVYYKHAA